jgi:hypothetical protein
MDEEGEGSLEVLEYSAFLGTFLLECCGMID